MTLLSWKEFREGKTSPMESVKIKEVDEIMKIINEATIEDYISIKGIGPKIANKILDKKPFNSTKEVYKTISASVADKLFSWARKRNL